MKPAAFDYHRPQSLADALALLARHGDAAKPIAGGQSLGPMLNMRLARPAHLVDLNDLYELDFVRADDTTLEIGAMTRHHRVATAREVRMAHPLLAAAAATIGHYPIRQRGTLGGSLVHADPAAQFPLVAVLSGATIRAEGPSGKRDIPAREFFQSVMTVDLKPGEMVTSVAFPRLSETTGWGFDLFSRRRGDFAIVALAVTVDLDAEGAVHDLTVAVGGVDAFPRRLDVSNFPGLGQTPAATFAADLGGFVAGAIAPEDAERMPAAFRKEIAAELAQNAATAALARARENGS